VQCRLLWKKYFFDPSKVKPRMGESVLGKSATVLGKLVIAK
jgi:hypothetical protein